MKIALVIALFLFNTPGDPKSWKTMLAKGQISKGEYEDLVQGVKECYKMKALTDMGMKRIKRNKKKL